MRERERVRNTAGIWRGSVSYICVDKVQFPVVGREGDRGGEGRGGEERRGEEREGGRFSFLL